MSKNSEVGLLTEIRSSKVDSLSLDDYLEEWGNIPKCMPRNPKKPFLNPFFRSLFPVYLGKWA